MAEIITQSEIEKMLSEVFDEQFFVSVFLCPIEQKYSTLKDAAKLLRERLANSKNESVTEKINDTIKWLDDALLIIEKAQGQNYHNRRYEPLEIPNVVTTPTESNIAENTEVEWHMDRMDAIREKQKSKNRKPKPIKKKGEFNHPSSRTINCIGVEAAYDTPEGREYMKKRNEDFEEFKRNNC
jgi:hypothetical protein